MPGPDNTSPIMGNSASSRAKSQPPTSSSPPQSPHRVKLPGTPAAVSRPNPLDAEKVVDQRRSGSEAPPSASARAEGAAAAGSQAQSTARQGVTRSTSATSTKQDKGDENEKLKGRLPAPPPPAIDMETFGQILELDEEGDEEPFSRTVVGDWYDQVGVTVREMKTALDEGDVAKLSSLGHFLKGSSAALGVTKVKETCEKIQNLGRLQQGDGTGSTTKDEALNEIGRLLKEVDIHYDEAKVYFDDFFKKPR